MFHTYSHLGFFLGWIVTQMSKCYEIWNAATKGFSGVMPQKRLHDALHILARNHTHSNDKSGGGLDRTRLGTF